MTSGEMAKIRYLFSGPLILQFSITFKDLVDVLAVYESVILFLLIPSNGILQFLRFDWLTGNDV